jgi:hypothetical protein
VLEEALADGHLRLGDGDPLILAISNDLGCLADELGNRHEARRNFARVATAGPDVLGEDHWMVRAAREYLGDQQPTPVLRQPPAAEAPPARPTPPPSARRTPEYVETVPAQATGSAYPVEPQPPTVQPPQAAPACPAVEPEPEPSRTPVTDATTTRGRGALIVTTAAACVAAVLATVALLMVVTDRPEAPTGDTPPTAPGPTLAGDPPTDLRLQDNGTAVTVTWTDPTAGTVPFIVAGGRAGQTLGAMATVNPGQTSFTINGLNPRLDYCFTVLAVYSTDRYATSGQVCTSRTTPTPR